MHQQNRPSGRYRINMIDEWGTISLLAPAHGPKMITAMAGLEFDSTKDMLLAVSALDSSWIWQVQSQLAMFDEFNIDELHDDWHEIIGGKDSAVHPAFRVID